MRLVETLETVPNKAAGKVVLKHSLPEIGYVFGAAALLTFWINSPYWLRTYQLLHLTSLMDAVFMLSQMLLVLGVTTAVLLLFCWGRFAKPLLTLLFVISIACAYFSFNYQVYIDRHMLTNVMRTDVHEAKDLLSLKLLLWMVVFLLPAMLYVWGVGRRPIQKWWRNLSFHLLFALLGVALGLAASLPIYKNYASFFRNNKQVVKMLVPFNFITASVGYAQHQYRDAHQVYVHVGMDAKQVKPATVNKPTLFVVVVGETGRGDRFSLNGYARNTNPLLSKQQGVISFQNAQSCGTATAYSVPCMFSDLSRQDINIDNAPMRDNLLDITQRAGVKVEWVDNNSGCQETCGRVPTQQLKQDCPEGLCYDEQLVGALQQRLQQPLQADQFLVLHMNGSHGPAYYQRYPKQYEVFKPACNTNEINTCSQEALNNVYDNTVVYTDAVLNSLIETLKQQQDVNTAMIYLSDHGESLGEKGLYLHGTPYAIAPTEQTHIQMLFWANPQFYQQHAVNPSCLQNMAKSQAVSQDNLFHTVLGGLNVHTQAYSGKLDVLNACSQGKA
ncbi:phosphoethanolamine--lipid A transferase [Vitreoscilla massiliensis]|uniref:Phosphoethanolamine--lipid A transferase n=1 Tax=Vitreoscilla massiliensis TaxID=1689272 RepID=A0ABY4DZH7_9NEIS|nr:phosphoethanolamine--lipid A transferase [Vitreoscilla massiliensis]UOO88399.1 phosphoethanolamine--lipid A transferase [Vitreoscilla massiliensis]